LYQRKRDSEGVENTFPVMGYPEQPPEPGITRPEFAFARQGIAMTSVLSLGIDVSKHHLDLASETRTFKRYPNTAVGIRALVERLAGMGPFRITVESTGIYSLPICEACAEAGLPIFLAHPGRVRKYAHSQGYLAKTDAIDARVIAEFGRDNKRIRPFVGPSAAQKRLRSMVNRRDQLVEDRVREEGRLEACREGLIRKELQQAISRLNKNIARWDQKIAEAMRENEDMAAKYDVLCSTTGVASVTASVLLAHLPELGSVNRQVVAALAGIAPYNRDSGKQQGRRTIYGGRQRVRQALYMAAQTAVMAKNKSPFVQVFQQLKAQGKPYKVAIIAVARKLLAYHNTRMKQLNEVRQLAVAKP
jgi:transposase